MSSEIGVLREAMANQVMLFMNQEDEQSFVQFLERYTFDVYPRRVPPDWQTFRAALKSFDKFPEEEVYLVASDIGPAQVDKIKRGPDKGSWRVDEVRSPVIFWERNTVNFDEEMVSGQLWAELEVTQQTGRKNAAHDAFRIRYLEIEQWIHKTFRKGHPKGFYVGPKAAKKFKEGKVKFRENKHFGRSIEVQ
jgi:hypothetical protein